MSKPGETLVCEIARILSEELFISIATDAELVESGLLDSVTLVRLLVAIEERLGVSLPIDALSVDQIRSINSIAETVAQSLMEPEEEISAPAAAGVTP